MASANLPVWATHNSMDIDTPPFYTIDYVNLINTAPVPPTPLAKKTIFTVSSNNHDAWTRTYDPTFKENGLNVYEWMLQYRRFLSVLPVAGLQLNATTVDDNKVSLQWNTNSETNVADFAVQKSTDGIIYSEIAVVDNTAVNGGGASYSYQDINVLPGIIYYRIAVSDNDGYRTYSDIKTVHIKAGGSVSLYPNPADRELKITTTGISLNNSVLQIINASGQIVQRERLNGTAPYSINISALPAGTYYAVIDDKAGKQKLAFIKR